MRRLLAVLVLFVVGCGGRAVPAPKVEYPTFAPTDPAGEGDPPPVVREAEGVAPSSPPLADRAEASSAPLPAPLHGGTSSRSRERPGLGTEFGERRTSQVHDVAFVRDSARPFSVITLNYNDRRGVDQLLALAGRRGEGYRQWEGGGAVTVSVRDEEGDFLDAIHAGDRTYVIGQVGQRYSIVLQNHTGHRLEAVSTVDGLDVISGKPGTLDNRGYVLMPYASLEIEGFRTSTSDVAAFRFSRVADSYAAQTGSARNVGVIGVALFAERGAAFRPDSDTRLRDSATPFPGDTRFARPPRR